MYQLFQQDAVEWLRSLADESVDLVITDPAYESLEKYRKVGTTTRLKSKWFEIFPDERVYDLFVELYRVLKRNAHCYVMVNQDSLYPYRHFGQAAGFKFWKFLVWDKKKMSTGYHWRNSHELVLFFEKGKRNLNNLGIRDVLEYPSLRGKSFYPTAKPPEVAMDLMLNSSNRGELVIDPFMGGGFVGQATVGMNRNFAGTDISEEAFSRTSDLLGTIGESGQVVTHRPVQQGLFKKQED